MYWKIIHYKIFFNFKNPYILSFFLTFLNHHETKLDYEYNDGTVIKKSTIDVKSGSFKK